MKQITVSLKDSEHKALLEIMEINGINCLHKAVKMAIEDFIKHYAKKANFIIECQMENL
jgi:hypothetical protein